ERKFFYRAGIPALFFAFMPPNYLELHLHTPYSFRDGGSEIESLVARADKLGMTALAMTDHDNTSASVKFASACEVRGIKPILGAEITMEDGSHLTLLARNRQGYAQLCTLISRAYAYGGRLTPLLPWAELGIERERGGEGENGINVDCKLKIEKCKLQIGSNNDCEDK